MADTRLVRVYYERGRVLVVRQSDGAAFICVGLGDGRIERIPFDLHSGCTGGGWDKGVYTSWDEGLVSASDAVALELLGVQGSAALGPRVQRVQQQGIDVLVPSSPPTRVTQADLDVWVYKP